MKKKIDEEFEMGKIQLQPGWMLRDCSTAKGGIYYVRDLVEEQSTNKGNGLVTTHITHRTTDNVAHVTAVDAVVKKVDYVLRKYCVRTEIGWFADDAHLKMVLTEVEGLKAEAAALNAQAPLFKSERQAYISVVPLRIDYDHEAMVRETARTVREVLTEIRDALRHGDIAAIHKLKIRSKGLHRLAVGIQSDVIRMALERLPVCSEALREAANAAKRGKRSALAASKESKADQLKAVERAGHTAAARVGAQLDLATFDNAITLFEGDPEVVPVKAAG